MEQQEDRPMERATSGRIRSRFFMVLFGLEEAAARGSREAKTHKAGEGKKFGHVARMLEVTCSVAMKKPRESA
jgi:hypothetical protein